MGKRRNKFPRGLFQSKFFSAVFSFDISFPIGWYGPNFIGKKNFIDDCKNLFDFIELEVIIRKLKFLMLYQTFFFFNWLLGGAICSGELVLPKSYQTVAVAVVCYKEKRRTVQSLNWNFCLFYFKRLKALPKSVQYQEAFTWEG